MGTLHRSVTAAAIASVLVILLAAPVLAHAELASSDPEDGAVLATPPTTVTVTFTEGLDLAKSSIKLSGPSGTVGTAKPARRGDTVMTLEGLALLPGVYGIQWTAAGGDGHVERGKLSFSVLEATPAPPTPRPTPAPTELATEASASSAPASPIASEAPASTAPAANPASGDDASPAAGSGGDVLIAIVAGLLLVGGLGGFLLRRGRGA